MVDIEAVVAEAARDVTSRRAVIDRYSVCSERMADIGGY